MANFDRVLTLTPKGLNAFVTDLLSLEKQTKVVVDRNQTDDYGDYKRVEVPIPTEEIWTIVGIQNGENGTFRVQVQNSILDTLSTRKDRAEAATAYESVK